MSFSGAFAWARRGLASISGKKEFVFNARPHPGPLPQEREKHSALYVRHISLVVVPRFARDGFGNSRLHFADKKKYVAPVHLRHLRLRDFRNYPRLDVDFAPGFHLLLGDNAQGKTNILESIYLMATLRSFRGVGGSQMVRHAQKGYFVGGRVVGQGEHEIKMYWSARERNLSLDGRPIRKLTDYLGTLRTVVFCTEDLQLIKGAGRSRRRFLDLLLSQTQPAYLPMLQRYSQALRSRNALLKQAAPDEGALE